MSQRLERLARLHALRKQVADAAAVECRQLAHSLDTTKRAADALRTTMNDAVATAGQGEKTWATQQAVLCAASLQLTQNARRSDALAEAQTAAQSRERVAMTEREQMQRMLDRRTEAERVEAERRVQHTLDDMFSIAQVRRDMATRF